MRIALGVEYAGNQYHGWQLQSGLYTVQECVENALSTVADHPVGVTCAGRTDTGVHATGQVIHFDSEVNRSMHSWVYGANSFLPKDISLRWAKQVSEDFHARYAAVSRRYRYVIYNNSIRPSLLRSYVSWQYRQLNSELMHEAAAYLIGEHDFTSFRSTECQSSTPMRNITELSVTRQQHYVVINVTANAFLHHMIRNIAGVLMVVGSGRRPKDWVLEVLHAKNRGLGAETAPPYGLYLTSVNYPAHFQIPENSSSIFYLD